MQWWTVPTGFGYALVQGGDNVLWVTTGGEKGPGTRRVSSPIHGELGGVG